MIAKNGSPESLCNLGVYFVTKSMKAVEELKVVTTDLRQDIAVMRANTTDARQEILSLITPLSFAPPAY